MVDVEITLGNGVGIVESKDCSFKADAMFSKILPALVLIPLKTHNWPR